MHEIQRNLLYEVKKEANKRSDPYYNPDSQGDDIRAENQKLRTKIRSQDTQIIRLNSKIGDLAQKILMLTTSNKANQIHKQETMKSAISELSSIPMLLQNKDLKQSNQIMHQQLLRMNGKNNQLQAELRQLKSDKYQLQLRIKEFNILQKMRQERFKDQVDRLTPIIIEQPSDYTVIKDSTKHLTQFIRQKIVQVVDNLFMLSAKQCEHNKKLNSFTVFSNYWRQLKLKKTYGYAAAISTYTALRKVMKMIDDKYGHIDYEEGQLQGTIDQWVFQSVVEIKAGLNKQEQRRLFRLLGLKYRCKFPIKGEKFDMSNQIKGYLQHAICEQIIKILIPNQNLNQTKAKTNLNQSQEQSNKDN